MTRELARHDYTISPGTLYPLLHRLEEAGLLRSTSQVIDGRARRVYTVTATGTRALTKLHAAVTELAEEVLATALPEHRPTHPSR